MSSRSVVHTQLVDIGVYLAGRREALLAAWRQAVRGDPAIPTGTTLDRQGIHDHIPEFLDSLEQSLRAQAAEQPSRSAQQPSRSADEAQQPDGAAHGLHRWQQGYRLKEVLAEWGHLHLGLIAEVNRYHAQHPGVPREAVDAARMIIAKACHAGVADSTAEFARLREVEADGRMQDLKQALARLDSIERDRAQAWREAAHDLRSNVGAVLRAGAVLGHPRLPQEHRDERAAVFKGNIASLRSLLDDLLELSRIEAGRETVSAAPFDAAQLLRELYALYEPAARDKGLVLAIVAPESLPVTGDAVKVRRILQNLLVNALKYTEAGTVRLSCTLGDADAARRWIVEVEDTGPGLEATGAGALVRELQDATQQSDDHHDVARQGGAGARARLTLVRPDREPAVDAPILPPSEGVGLTIVKRLCELLGATLEVRTEAQRGSLFRVTFPLGPVER